MVFRLEFSVSSATAESEIKNRLLPFLFLWELLKSQGQVISFETTHMVPDKYWDLPIFPTWVHFISVYEEHRSLSHWQKLPKKRFELNTSHLPLEVHWSHQCHIQTGRNPVQQWRQWKPGSRWSVGNETQGWETQGNFHYLPSCQSAAWTSGRLHRLVLAPWYSFTVCPMLPTGVIHTGMWEAFIKGPT